MFLKIKTILFAILCTAQICLISQTKNQLNSQKYYDQKKYADALKHALKAIEDKVSSKEPLSYYLASQANWQISKIEAYDKKYPNAAKDALKQLNKAIDKTKNKEKDQDFAKFDWLRNDIATKSFKEAKLYFDQERFSKALAIFKNVNEIRQDTLSYFYIGKCYLYNQETKEAIPIYENVVNYNYSAFVAEVCPNTYIEEAFYTLSQYYYALKKWDTVTLVTKQGLEIFPNSKELKKIDYKLLMRDLEQTPPSFNYLDKIQKALKIHVNDTQLLFKENSLFLHLIKSTYNNSQKKVTDSVIDIFVKNKINKFNNKNSIYDYFTEKNEIDVLKKLYTYTNQYKYGNISAFVYERYIKNILSKKELTYNDWSNYQSSIDSLPFYFQKTIFDYQLLHFPKEIKLKEKKKKIFTNWTASNIKYEEYESLISLNKELIKEYPSDKV